MVQMGSMKRLQNGTAMVNEDSKKMVQLWSMKTAQNGTAGVNKDSTK